MPTNSTHGWIFKDSFIFLFDSSFLPRDIALALALALAFFLVFLASVVSSLSSSSSVFRGYSQALVVFLLSLYLWTLLGYL